MKRTSSLLLALALLVLLGAPALAAPPPSGTVSVQLCQWATQTYTPVSAVTVGLTLNGQPLEGDVPAIVHNGRTLVPVRLVGEALQAQVLWVQTTGQVILIRDGDVVVLTLDSANAVVNGAVSPLPDGVPAMAVRYQDVDRTMIPLRFVSEALGASVDWDQDTYTAHLTAELAPELPPEPTEPPAASDGATVTDIRSDPARHTVFIATDHTPNYQLLDLGDRVVVDVLGAGLWAGLTGSIPLESGPISAIRYAQHGDTLYPGYDRAVRVVLDLREGVSLSEDISVETQADGILLTVAPVQGGYIPPTPIQPEQYTIVIDPGHGGEQPGAVYEGIHEKLINLAVAQKLDALLRDLGYNVVMTRYDDTGIGLYERADVANAVGADLFVSLHSNAAVNSPDFTGIYTYYHPASKTGPDLAQAIQTPVCAATGAIDRGTLSADFVVLRETEMCAVLVEMGFMTNHDELMALMDDDYRTKLAQGVAQGIVDYLNGLQTQE